MNITVYCGSSEGGSPAYRERAAQLGRWIGENGHTLIFGGSGTGLMGTVADAALDAGGRVTGVQPDVQLIRERRHPRLTGYVDTKTISERKEVMYTRGDAFVALPGGVGTLDEITEVLSLSSLGLVSGPVVFVDTEGYYRPLRAVLDNIVAGGFGRSEYFEEVLFSDDIAEIAAHLEGAAAGGSGPGTSGTGPRRE